MNAHVEVFGYVGVLAVGSGDTKLSFDPSNPAERIRAARIVKDMIRRGYALLVEVERDGVKKFERALDFDEATCEYIIADFDPVIAAAADADDAQPAGPKLRTGINDGPDLPTKGIHNEHVEAAAPPSGARGKKGKVGRKAIDATKTRAISVARTAGG